MGQVYFVTPQEAETERLASWRANARVSKFQAKAALVRSGLYGQVQQMMNALGEADETRLAWEDATEFQRGSPTVQAMATQLGLDDAALDALFEQAATITA